MGAHKDCTVGEGCDTSGHRTSGWKSKPRSAWMRSMFATFPRSFSAFTCSERRTPSYTTSSS